jgi:hypothetical protein
MVFVGNNIIVFAWLDEAGEDEELVKVYFWRIVLIEQVRVGHIEDLAVITIILSGLI